MLIAFNAAPGTVAPAEQGPYGVYAQSLAEMIRTGGLPLPEVFNRVRLRVNEASKGAQVPWDSQKVDAPFMFFERAPDAPAPPPPDQVAAIRNKPIRDLGVQDAYTAALERDTLQGYEDFLGAYPSDPLAKRVRAIVAARREAITWRRTYRTDTPNAYWSYLQRYPRGPHAADARRRLAILTAPLEPPPTFDVIDYDVPPPPPDEFVYVDRPVLAFGDPEFDFVPPPPPPVFFLPPPPDDFIVLAPPPPPIGLFILPQPIFVPIPVYVRAPVYVAPPPNNIIFANIHNRTVINNVINRPPQPGLPGVVPGVKAGARANGAVVAPAVTVAPGQGGATPTLPPAVAQRATLIQQGKLPVPPSAAINPAVKTGLPALRADRNAKRDAAGECAERAASEPVLAEDQCAAGSRRQGRATRASERRGIAAGRGQSKCEACAGRNASGISGSGHPGAAPAQARRRGDCSCSPGWIAETGRYRARTSDAGTAGRCRKTTGRCAAAQRRRAVEAGRCHRAETSVAARNSACAAATSRGAGGEAAAGCPRCATASATAGGGATATGSPPRRRLGWPRRRHPHRGWLHRRLASPRHRRRPGWLHPRRGRPRRLQRRQPRGARRTFRNADCLGRSHRCVAGPALIRRATRPRKLALFPCFWLESGYTPRHLTRKHGSKGRPVAAGP